MEKKKRGQTFLPDHISCQGFAPSLRKAQNIDMKCALEEVLFGRSFLKFFLLWKVLKKYEKWHYFCEHAHYDHLRDAKNVEKRHLASLNLTF